MYSYNYRKLKKKIKPTFFPKSLAYPLYRSDFSVYVDLDLGLTFQLRPLSVELELKGKFRLHNKVLYIYVIVVQYPEPGSFWNSRQKTHITNSSVCIPCHLWLEHVTRWVRSRTAQCWPDCGRVWTSVGQWACWCDNRKT